MSTTSMVRTLGELFSFAPTLSTLAASAEVDAVAPARASSPPAPPRSSAPPPLPARAARPRLVVAVDMASDSQFFSGLSGEVEEGGLFVATYRALDVGSEVLVELSLPGLAGPLHASGKVRWLREHSVDLPRGVGVAFEHLSDETRDRIRAFCEARPPLYYEDV